LPDYGVAGLPNQTIKAFGKIAFVFVPWPSSSIFIFQITSLLVPTVLWIPIGFNADPNPAFFVNADPDPGLCHLMTKKIFKKFKAEKSLYFFIKNCNLLSLRLHKGRPNSRRILHPSKDT
jgi:hypothetical protein